MAKRRRPASGNGKGNAEEPQLFATIPPAPGAGGTSAKPASLAIPPTLAVDPDAWRSPETLVVSASAGTGKTWLLIRRALWLVLEKRVPVERLVALTFAEKAAGELGSRLREALEKTVRSRSRDALPDAVKGMAPLESLDTLAGRARAALRDLPRAGIATIHSFAASILRLYPVEAGVDPEFRIMEPGAEGEAVRREWEAFLKEQLAGDNPRSAEWAVVLRQVPIGELADLAAALAGWRVDLDTAVAVEGGLNPELAGWIALTRDRAIAVQAACEPRNKRPAEMAFAVRVAAEAVLRDGRAALRDHEAALTAAPAMTSGWPKAWDSGEAATGREVGRALKELASASREAPALAALGLLKPFALHVRVKLLAGGFITYDGLLAVARDLLRTRTDVREALKRRYDAILVDEVQDTDPIQLEILLYLAEEPGTAASHWRDVRLVRGKLMLVGDPKQSIYGFRHADLKAYRTVTDLVKSQGAKEVALTQSMRSGGAIISAVNAVGGYVFGQASFAGPGGIEYLPLAAGSRADKGSRPVVIRVAPVPGEARDVTEARGAAGWIAARLAAMPAGTRSLAVLFPQKRYMSAYASALRRLGIPVVIEDERSFFRRRAVADLINAFRVVADPGDEPALAGLLRSAYGGLDDAGLADWFGRWRAAGARADWMALANASRIPGCPPGLPGLFRDLGGLAAGLAAVPAATWTAGFMTVLSARALADAGNRPGDREATESFQRMLAQLLDGHGWLVTLDLLDECVRAEARNENPPVEPPPVVRTAADGTVRLMTIHAAKGLEFPAVVIGGARSGHRRTRATDTEFRYDWSSGMAGVKLASKDPGTAIATLEGAYLTLAEQDRDAAQDRRVLYVALTRAKDDLAVMEMGEAVTRKAGPSLMALLAPALEANPGAFGVVDAGLAPGEAGAGMIETSEGGEAGSSRGSGPTGPDPGWEARHEYAPPIPLASPSELDERIREPQDGSLPPGTRSAAALLGELCHRVLERMDFGSPDPAGEVIRAAAAQAHPVPASMVGRAGEILVAFAGSEAVRELARAEILGREVPLLATVGGRPVSARADLVYRLDSRLYVGDFKLAENPSVPGVVAAAYAGAVSAAWGEPAVFALISLYSGRIIPQS